MQISILIGTMTCMLVQCSFNITVQLYNVVGLALHRDPKRGGDRGCPPQGGPPIPRYGMHVLFLACFTWCELMMVQCESLKECLYTNLAFAPRVLRLELNKLQYQ